MLNSKIKNWGAEIARLLAVTLIALTLGACASTNENRSTGEVIDDTTVQAKVKTALLNDPIIKGMEVNVDVNRGLVQLGGFVNSVEEKRKATEIAQGVGGVKEVRNNLQIRQ